MSDDIVDRLRAVLHNDRSVELMNREAADEIEDLMFRLKVTIGELDNALSRERTLLSEQDDCRIGADNLDAEIERLTAERDEARRIYCKQMSNISRQQDCTPQWFAEEMEWDCFKEER